MRKRLLQTLVILSMLLVVGCDSTGQSQTPAPILSTPPAPAPLSLYVSALDTLMQKSSISALDASTGKPRWQYNLSPQTQDRPILSQNVLYAGSSDGKVSALNASDGKLRWRSSLGKGAFPLIVGVKNGAVYVVLTPGQLSSYNIGGPILALNATNGSTKWKTRLQGTIVGVTQDTLYAASEQTLYALNAANGKVRWQFQAEEPIEWVQAVNGHIYVYTSNQSELGGGPAFAAVLYDLSPSDGSLVWRYPGQNYQEQIYLVGIENGVLYLTDSDQLATSSTQQPIQDELLALNASNGSLMWRYQQSELDSFGFGVAIEHGTIYIAGDDGTLYALNEPDGSLRWHSHVADEGFSIMLGDDGNLYASSPDQGSIFALSSQDGTILWQYGEALQASIITVINGVLYGATYRFPNATTDSLVFALKTTDGSKLWTYNAGTAQITPVLG
jgi:outer membrane protein assembly factor BamB